jgi:hypothetical protein
MVYLNPAKAKMKSNDNKAFPCFKPFLKKKHFGQMFAYPDSAIGFNTLNAELNPICHLLALLETDPILHVSRIRVKTHFYYP